MSEYSKNRLINYRPLLELALGMMAGISICANASETALYFIVFAAFFTGTVLFLLKKRRMALLLAAVLFGLASASAAQPIRFYNGNAELSGVVRSIEGAYSSKTQSSEGSQTQSSNGSDTDAITVILGSVSINGERFNKRAKLFLKTDGEVPLEIGDRVVSSAYVRLPSRHFGTYNEYRSLLSKGIGCVASASSARLLSRNNLPLHEAVCSVRGSVEGRIKAVFGEDSGLFSALLLGVRDELDSERAEAYRATGTAHLLAISGFHMGVIVGAVSILIPKKKRALKLVVVCVAAALYCTIAAYTPGIVRAAIMTVCLLSANALERRPDTLSSLSLAAVLILTFSPFQLYSAGFQLSFAAVYGIALFSGSLNRMFRRIKLPLKLSQAIAVCVCAAIGTLMLQLRYFNAFTPYSVAANLIAVPAFSAIVILGVVSVLISYLFPPAALAFAVIPRGILFTVERLLDLVSALPLAHVELAPPSLISCAIFAALLFTASEYTLRPWRKRLEFALPLLILFTFSYLMGIMNA